LVQNGKAQYDATFRLYTDEQGSKSAFAQADNVGVRIVESYPRISRTLPDDWWINTMLPRAAREDRVDLFFSPYYKVPLPLSVMRINMIHDLSFFVLPAELIAERYRSKLQRWRLRRLMQLYCAKAQFTVTVSEYSRHCLQSVLGLDPARIRVCSNGVDLDVFTSLDHRQVRALRDACGLPEDYLLYVGSNIKKKNLEGLLAAYALLPREQRERLPLVLRTKPGTLAQQAASLGIDDTIVVLEEQLSDEQMAALIGGARALALLSYDEGFGIPVIEAMAAGVPVVVSKGGALAEVAGDAGMLVDPASPREAANALMQVLACSSEDYQRLSARCRARAELFSAARAADRLFAVMEEAIVSRTPRAHDAALFAHDA
jgi:glycosyltransferase involved in cell wall biosynthesis